MAVSKNQGLVKKRLPALQTTFLHSGRQNSANDTIFDADPTALLRATNFDNVKSIATLGQAREVERGIRGEDRSAGTAVLLTKPPQFVLR